MTACVDLAARFGDRFRLTWEADGVTKSEWTREDWPWLQRIRCRYGEVYPYGGELLQAMTARPRLGTRLRALPFVLHARGDIETVVQFHVDHLNAVLAILKPYRRRQISAAEKARLIAAGTEHRFETGAAHGVQSDFPGLESSPAPRPIANPQPELRRVSGAPELLASLSRGAGKIFWPGTLRAAHPPGLAQDQFVTGPAVAGASRDE